MPGRLRDECSDLSEVDSHYGGRVLRALVHSSRSRGLLPSLYDLSIIKRPSAD